MISYICLLAAVFANLSCADDMDNSKFDNMIPYGKQEVSYTYPKGEDNLRVLTFNIRHCAGSDDVINYDRTAAIINGMEPDIVCLQEVDYMTTRSNKVDQLKTLADKTGMNHYFSKSITYQGGEYGNGLLFKGTPVSTRTYPLPGTELRSAAIAEFENYVVISTHLALEENNRVESAKLLTQLAKEYKKVVYMAGDFNEDLMNGAFFTELKKEWNVVSSTENTFPTGQSTKRIDFVVALKSPATSVVKSNVVYNLDGVNVSMASDHYPLYCDFRKVTALEEFPKAAGDLRIANYFTKNCAGTDGIIDYDRIAAVINKMNSDIICLQGLDKETERSSGIDQLNTLAQKSNMHDYFAKAIDYKGGEFGVGILTKDEPISVDRYQIPGKSEMRAAMVVEYEKFVVASTNFDTDMAKRIEALQTLHTKLSAYNKPAFLAGYFNEGNLESDFFKKVKEDWNLLSADKSTENGGKQRRLDFIISLKDHGVTVTQADVMEYLTGADVATASSHYPLFCDFTGLK